MPRTFRIIRMAIAGERDVVAARQRAREIGAQLGFASQDQIRIATTVSEIARNALAYAGGGHIEFDLEGEHKPQSLAIRVADHGPGIPDLDAMLAGTQLSAGRRGLGIVGTQRLMDECVIVSRPGEGTVVTMKKALPATAAVVTPAALGQLGARLAALPATGSFDELQLQNRELLNALADLRERQEELGRVACELEDTNRGVMALYAELDERAERLRRADAAKSRFLSNMSHELRTPLSSIRALSTLLLQRVDGDLGSEQEKQVSFIRKAAEDLSELVNDLLDLAKIEAGKVDVHVAPCQIDEMFSALRGMLRPLLTTQAVELVFDPAVQLPIIRTDEGKLSQILRNLISNALKYTERGTVRVTATLVAGGAQVEFKVADTGIGIAADAQHLIFEEFGQIEHPLQQRVKGTGLGLPLCRELCALLGGALRFESAPGEGSTFYVTLPTHGPAVAGMVPLVAPAGGAAQAAPAPAAPSENAPEAPESSGAANTPGQTRAASGRIANGLAGPASSDGAESPA